MTLRIALLLCGVAMLFSGNEAWAQEKAPKDLTAEFANPGPEFRGKPFWSWNGELKEDELIRQINVLKEMGMGGYFMHSRTGLATEYLGDEWFRLINVCADEGARLGMEAWLYDEDRWPSGTAGGLVTADPKFRQKYISMNTVSPKEFEWKDGIIAAFACTLDKNRYTDCERLTPTSKAAKLKDKTILVFTIETPVPSSFFNGNTDVDRLNREATDYFIQLTHEKYREKCGARLGTSIPGIFTDEPHRGAAFSGFGVDNANCYRMTSWTDRLPEEFQKRFGYDIIEKLPELFLKKDGQAVAPVKWHYMELLQELFLENWCKPFREWCDRNNMIFTGHFLHEDSLTCQAAVHGSLMRAYEYEQYPGVDVLTEGNRNYWIVKQLSSAARQLGQKMLLSELYGCTGWQFNFQSHKAVGDWQALFGINLRCQHLSWYTMAGEAKRDYPASIFFQSGWWKDYHFVEDYYARMNLLLAQGKPACDVLMLNPIESVWCQVGIGWAEELSAKAKEIQDLERAYTEVFFWLTGSHIDFDYGDEEMFARLCHVENSGGEPILRFGQAEYRVVIVPKMTTIRSTSFKLLDEFHKAGGKVVFVGDAPEYVDAVTSAAATDLAKQAVAVPWKRDALMDAVNVSLRMPVEIVDASGVSAEKIFCQLRDDNGTKILVAINTSTDEWQRDTLLRVKNGGAVSEWNCLTGERCTVPARENSGWTEFTTDFAPSGEHCYLLTAKPIPNLPPQPQYKEIGRQVCSGPFAYTLSEPNVCVLDLADYQINDQPVQTETEILKIDRAVRKAFDLPMRGGDMVQPWYSKKFAAKPENKGKVRIMFSFQVKTVPEGTVQLAIEEPQNFAIVFNGHTLSNTPNGWWVDPAIKTIDLPLDFFVQSNNQIELITDFRQDMNLEALYLLGQFGVRIEKTQKSLIPLPEKLAVGDLTTQGLPFYSGTVTYRIPVEKKPDTGQYAFIAASKFEAACIKPAADKIIPWPPFEADVTKEIQEGGELQVQVVLTRRNTFGPLHQVPVRAGSYGPGSWTTGGKGWSQEYQLYPAGLLEAPIILLRASSDS
ncbi:MAG TPA: glycosyl hydrolase [Candidatus Hydrogenedentes bacterium]|nr:glycosyl hydrolase [Candidatus Hydrogenedentota bacterium]